MKNIDLSLILPCFNEGPTLRNSLKEIISTLNEMTYSWEILAIDDSSTDMTAKTLSSFAREKKLRIYRHNKNIGRGGTVIEGFLKAKGNVVGFIDVDLEISPVYIPKFVRSIISGSDVAIGIRNYKENLSSLGRWILSKGYLFLVKFMLDLKVSDTEAGYKFFNRKKILPVITLIKDHGWFFDTEIVALSSYKNLKITQIPVLFLRRPDKESTVRILPDTFSYLKALIKFKGRFDNPYHKNTY